MTVQWQYSRWSELSCETLYKVLAAREAVFHIEQNCVYRDCDGLDRHAWHIIGWSEVNKESVVAAYCRIVAPGVKRKEIVIGRVLIEASMRGTGLGKELMRRALEKASIEYPAQPVCVSAQQYLVAFYEAFGFEAVSEPYDDAGVIHVDMVRATKA